MIPYAPDRQLYVPSTRAQDIILRQGEAAADSAARSGQIWGNALQDLGGIASGYVHDRAAQKEEQRRTDAMNKRENALFNLIGDGSKLPDYREVRKVVGPEKADETYNTITSYFKLKNQPTTVKPEDVARVGRAWLGLSPEAQAKSYPGLKSAAAPLFPGLPMPEELNDETRPQVINFINSLTPPDKPQGPIKLNKNERLIENGKEIIPVMPEASKPETRSLQIQLADALSSGDTAKAASIKSAIRQAASAGHIESAPSLKSAAVQDAEGNTILANYDSKSGKYFDTSGKEIKDPKKALGATESNRAASAETVSRIATNLEDKLKDPKVSGALGPAMGRYNTLKEFIGNPPPELSDLAGEIESFALANMGVHGMRSVQGADKIAKLLNAKHTPESLAAAIRGLTVFSNEYLKTVGRGSKASSPSAKPSASRLSATNPKTGEKLYSDDGGETWHK